MAASTVLLGPCEDAALPALLESYPRDRPALPPRYAEVYAEQYRINRDGDTLVDGAAQKLEEWMHRQVASCPGGPILELGAGTLSHLRFERQAADYDVVEPFKELYLGRSETSRVREFFDDAREVPLDRCYRRIISIAVLEHLPDLPGDVARSALLLDQDGAFQAGIPSEGGLLWWTAWRFSTGIGYFLRAGLDYGVVMRHEHLNKAREIERVVGHFFEKVAIRRYPTPFHHLSFYAYLEARRPKKDVARRYLDRLEAVADARQTVALGEAA